jgi:PAS domain S-box-containing protein
MWSGTAGHVPSSRFDSERSLDSFKPFHLESRTMLQWLNEYREQIIEEWVDNLSGLSPSYERRPREELFETVTEAFEANWEALAYRKMDRMERFIDFITQMRLEAGFALSDVQKAFELFRLIVVRRLQVEERVDVLAQFIEPLNACLSFTIHKFSDHFQSMHERSIRQHAEGLERMITLRTEQLAASERRYKTLVEEINDGFFVIQDELIIFANEAFSRMHGTTLEEVQGRPFLRFVAAECRERVLHRYQDTLANRPMNGPLEYIRLGCPRDKAATEIKARVVDLGQGPVILGICRDISERVAMESKVREHERMAYVGRLTTSLSHEIRNPLSSIMLNLQILSRKLELDGFDRRRMEITVHEVSRLEGILRQLLDTARPLNIRLQPVDLSELARGCADLVEPKAGEKGLQIVQRYPRKAPLCRLDGGRVEQALINLLLNAIEATSTGGVITLWTKAALAKEGRFLELGVRDTGSGIDSQLLPHLFTPFYTTKSQGTGLGLSNVKRIVDAHSGRVEVRSRKGRGATFVIRFPWNESADQSHGHRR